MREAAQPAQIAVTPAFAAVLKLYFHHKLCGMAFNEKLADRVRELIALKHDRVEEKRMFGGLCFMVNNKMCIGVESERLMLRIDPAACEAALQQPGCTPMDFTGKIMKGYVFVDAAVLRTKKQLSYWVKLALDYNQFAKASVKKKAATKQQGV